MKVLRLNEEQEQTLAHALGIAHQKMLDDTIEVSRSSTLTWFARDAVIKALKEQASATAELLNLIEEEEDESA